MTRNVSRRTALAAGAAAGMALGLGAQASEAEVLPDVWGEDFMVQWSEPDNVKRDLKPGKTPVRLSCQQFRLRPPKEVGFGEQVAAIRAAGYTACEGGSWEWVEADISDSQIRELKAALKQHDVLFYGLHTWVNIIHPDLAEREKYQQHVIGAVEKAERLGLEFILTHTGGNATGRNKDVPHPDNWTKETWMKSVAATKRILKDTSGSSIVLGFEAVNSCNNNTPKSHLRLKQDVGDDRVKVVLDPVNMLHPGVFYRTTELINECFDLIGEDIVYAHAKDLQWNEMLPHFEGVILGEGTMDYETYLVRLSRMKYSRAILIEHLPEEKYAPSKQYLEETAKKLGVTIYS